MLLAKKDFFCDCGYYRVQRGLTQSELAVLCDVSRNTISSIERREYLPSSYLAYRMCKALKVKFETLFTDTEDVI